MLKRWGSRTFILSVLLAGASAEAADAKDGWYVRADAGSGVGGDMDFDPPASIMGDEAGLDENWLLSAAAGRSFANGLRFEGEISYRDSDLTQPDCEQVCPAVVEGFDGESSALAAMANAYVDFNRDGALRPYVGAGAGLARVSVDLVVSTPLLPTVTDGEDTAFAWQALAGVAFALGERTQIDVGYRYFAVPEAQFTRQLGGESSAEYTHQAILAGVRIAF